MRELLVEIRDLKSEIRNPKSEGNPKSEIRRRNLSGPVAYVVPHLNAGGFAVAEYRKLSSNSTTSTKETR